MSQIVPVPGNEPIGRPGTLRTLLTKGDRSLMTINYAPRQHGQSQDHTGAQVRIAAQGPQAANAVGVTNQTDLFHTSTSALTSESSCAAMCLGERAISEKAQPRRPDVGDRAKQVR